MKVIGSVFIIGATTLLGCRIAIDMDSAYGELKYIRQILYMLQSEIRYSRSFLGEAFMEISKTAREPYGAWMRQLSYRMEHKNSGTFDKMWRETIQEYLIDLKIPAQELKRLKDLGQYLGSADTQMQVRHIELFEEQLETTMKEMKEGLHTKKRLCHCLGVMSGILLAILLI